jgi:S1-C subfamily serine protease
MSNTEIYEEVAESVVMIQCGNSTGSGFCVVKANPIITNNHVVNEGVPTILPPTLITNTTPKMIDTQTAML